MTRVPIEPFDAAWFYVEKWDAPAHFGPLIILSPPPEAGPDFVRSLVAEWRQVRQFAPPFNYRFARTRIPAWDVLPDDQVELEYHLRHSALPAPGDERELGMLISRLHSHRLDRRKPLWECHVIEGLEGGRFAIYLKLHHGQLDGMGAVKLMQRVYSHDPERRGMRPPWAVGMRVTGESRPSDSGHAAVKPPVPSRAQMAMSVPKALRSLTNLARDAYGKRNPDVKAPFLAPSTVLNRRIGPQRRYATQHYSLDRLKRIAKLGSVKMNDVFMAISGGGLRRYLLEIDALPDRPLIGQVPVNIRPGGDESVGNALSFMYITLGTDVADPVERLQAIARSTAASKRHHESLPPEALSPYTMLLVGPYITEVILNLGGRVPPAANLVISNVSGPRERMYFNGARVEHIYGPSVLFHGQALNITMSSYADEVDVGFTGCRDSLPSMQRLSVYTGEALDELEAALSPGRKRKR